ncbi:unnamed protein product [Ostreobium quekettii]|uniref:Glycosyltransferase family 28 N-terminal domain-containing protein n=1 Tax=Ostreobium quekettii TaxID=121088 RepID=A0A8S1IVI1_9CHLO|nr:unnamed protein product [Ostreobium quekettii]
MAVGTRGDVQPFIALGRRLQAYGHRVRVASHSVYREFVLASGLEFYPLGGDPKVICEFVVRNRGVLPIKMSDVAENRKQLREIIYSTYGACICPDPQGDGREFMAEALIANPPCYGHIHCAEKLGIPLHMVFTMPWTPTKDFLNPLARITDGMVSRLEHLTQVLPKQSATGWRKFIRDGVSWLSFVAMEDIVFLGMKDIVDQFRKEVLGLNALPNTQDTRHLLCTRQVPFMYCWSPSLIRKPSDWGQHIDVVGFFFLNQARLFQYQPSPELAEFLQAGLPPVYIGFGSMMVGNAKELTKIIFDAVAKAGVRALLSKGWSNLGQGFELPEAIMLLDDCPHDWLFPRCSAVVHHGGAGTTAAGLLAGCPTFITPFFGDQPFWADACHRAGVGPHPVYITDLTTDKLANAFACMSLPKVKQKAKAISERMQQEDGLGSAVESFHKNLPLDAILEKKKMIWNLCGGKVRFEGPDDAPPVVDALSPQAAGMWYWLFGWMCCSPIRRHKRNGTRGATGW